MRIHQELSDDELETVVIECGWSEIETAIANTWDDIARAEVRLIHELKKYPGGLEDGLNQMRNLYTDHIQWLNQMIKAAEKEPLEIANPDMAKLIEVGKITF
jgi:hypothetical protein